jgi:hypothetical protein
MNVFRQVKRLAAVYTEELLKDPNLYVPWLPAGFQREVYHQMVHEMLNAMHAVISGMSGTTEFMEHKVPHLSQLS